MTKCAFPWVCPDHATAFYSNEDAIKNAPIGTKAPALGGGRWYKTERGWKWNGPEGTGGTFPRPGGDWTGKLIYPEANHATA